LMSISHINRKGYKFTKWLITLKCFCFSISNVK